MPPTTPRFLTLALALAFVAPSAWATGFVYEGRLDDLGQPANGRYDLRLSVYPDAVHGAMLAGPIVFEDVVVVDGRFRVDFELPMVGASPAWIAVGVREGAAVGAFSTIPGRSEAVSAKLIGACWSSTGDSATNPAVNFIGTTDAQPFVVRTQNVQSLRIEPSTILFSGAPITSNTIAGSSANSVSTGVRGATIAGGGMPAGNSDPDFSAQAPNHITDHYGVVGGGYANQAGDAAGTPVDRAFATVGGGVSNNASGNGSTVGGGAFNIASGGNSTVGGGLIIIASGSRSTVGGGSSNDASGDLSTVGGGGFNTASGSASTVGGGSSNCAGGDFSWAGGRFARTRPGDEPGDGTCNTNSGDADGDNGTFVWADDQLSTFISTGPRQFLVRAQGGMAINSNDPAGSALRVAGTLRVDTLGTAAATTLCRNATNQISGCSSSARYKDHITDLDLGLAVVEQLRSVAYEWKTTHEADIGFVAEEIAAIDPRLVTRNADDQIEGVKYERLTAVLANAVQELAARDSLVAEDLAKVSAENESLRNESAELRSESAELRSELDRRDAEYRARLERLEALIGERLGGAR